MTDERGNLKTLTSTLHSSGILQDLLLLQATSLSINVET